MICSRIQGGILKWPRSRKRLVVVALDIGLSVLSMWLAFTLRLDVLHSPAGAEWVAYGVAPLLAVPTFVHFGLYRAIFRYTGVAAILATGKAVGAYGLMLSPVVWLLYSWDGIPRSLIVLQPLIFLLLVSSSRTLGWHWLAGRTSNLSSRLLIYGAGTAGAQTAAALASTQQYALIGFVDDDFTKWGRTINGVKVYSPTDVPDIVARFLINDILLALPSASRQRRNQIIGQLQSLPVHIRSIPGLADLASGRVSVDDFRDLDVEDLLGREPVVPQPELLARSLAQKVVLVTGAGGSIGSELCRQIASVGPSQLILVEHSEFALYRIHQELAALVKSEAIDVNLLPLLADVCNLERTSAICRKFRPQVVYHAAAYKHVPLVETNPGAGVINNVVGTLHMARAAIDASVDSFVLISTDKAVRPTNVMGASKRVAELVLQSLAATEMHPFDEGAGRHATCFSMVRFGNVLGSSGSVVPLFRAQIAAGGPLTITDPAVTRYFMTIPEAAQLVLHAGAIAEGGDLFVLDMGAPIKILDLAKRMIALSGLTVRDEDRPKGDIHIKILGLRPGEKLFEELLIGDNPLPTDHPRIIRAREDFTPWSDLQGHLKSLIAAAGSDNADAMSNMLQLLVPGYQPGRNSGRQSELPQAEKATGKEKVVECLSPRS